MRRGDINAGIGDKQETSLHLTARFGWDAAVNLLLSKGADINRKETNGWTALHLASQNGHLEIASRLLKADADTSLRTVDHRTAFHISCQCDQLEIHNKDADSNQPLHLTAINNSHKVVPWLLEKEKGAEIEHQGQWGWTPLRLACAWGSLQVAKLLLDGGADIHANNNSFNSPVHLACKNVLPDILQLLREHNARISEIDPNGNTCFHQVVYNEQDFSGEHRDVLDHLVAASTDINKPNLSGYTPL
ncbi:hypothetical protein LCI18_000206 [Fusarium solani-melongenae]|uniref:Uncharacterized protein n=1 Tax=Fusarium solani subsp. cucurbitae TaxID=2747967 RepID=A0ACD3YL23_FUSSC|nr:hypothetical protein LCI18_000206 [Fusarium solani-melongenae]